MPLLPDGTPFDVHVEVLFSEIEQEQSEIEGSALQHKPARILHVQLSSNEATARIFLDPLSSASY